LKKVLYSVLSIIILNSLISNGYANGESTAVSIVENLASNISQKAKQNPDAPNAAQQTTNETILPKMDELLATEKPQTEPAVSSKPTEQQVPNTNNSSLNDKSNKPKFIASDGTVYTPPEGFSLPPEMKEGWFYLTTNIEALKEKIAAAPNALNDSPPAVQSVTPNAVTHVDGQQPSNVMEATPPGSNAQSLNPAVIPQADVAMIGTQPNAADAKPAIVNNEAGNGNIANQTPAAAQTDRLASDNAKTGQPMETGVHSATNVPNEQTTVPQQSSSIRQNLDQNAPPVQPATSNQSIVTQGQQGQTPQSIGNAQTNNTKQPIMFQCYLA
jgi:hypothetical protein